LQPVLKTNTVSLMCAVHTSAAKSSIFTVQTVMHTNSIVATIYESSLPAIADHVIKMYGTSALAKKSTKKCLCTCRNRQNLTGLHHSHYN